MSTTQLRDRALGLAHDVHKRCGYLAEQRPSGGRVEQVGCGSQCELDARLGLTKPHRHIHARRWIHRFHRGGEDVTQHGGRSEDLVADHRLEKRMATGTAFGRQRVDHPIERNMLVRQGIETGCANPVEQFGRRRIARDVDTMDDGVHQISDGVAETTVGDDIPVRDRGADGDVGAAAEPVPCCSHGGFQHHQRADTVPNRGRSDVGGQCVFESTGRSDRPICRPARTRTIRREFELRRKTVELLRPVLQRLLDLTGLRPRAVHGRELGERGCGIALGGSTPFPVVGVGRGQRIEQHGHRGPVDSNMVDHDHERRPPRTAQVRRACRYRTLDVEGSGRVVPSG